MVRDTGIGIPAAKLGAVFEPFVQVRQELTRTAEGTGLGLSISRDLARGMAGELTVTSELGVGSTFTLVLPRAADLAPVADLSASTTPNREVEVREVLRREGAHGVLRYLNARTSHRFTGLYRFDGDVLRNVALFDRAHPRTERGTDAPLHQTYCSMVGARQRTVAIEDAARDPRVADHPARDAVVSYCGALVRAPDGRALGTLCSFDVEARPVPSDEIPLMEMVAPLLAEAVLADITRVAVGATHAG
jgi:GAF domain-containing protein